MKNIIRMIGMVALAAIMAFSAAVVASAETAEQEQPATVVAVEEDGGAKDYELVWRYKYENGHMWRRRWNKTLGEWYDPAWILVY